jgi:hypothetical protein
MNIRWKRYAALVALVLFAALFPAGDALAEVNFKVTEGAGLRVFDKTKGHYMEFMEYEVKKTGTEGGYDLFAASVPLGSFHYEAGGRGSGFLKNVQMLTIQNLALRTTVTLDIERYNPEKRLREVPAHDSNLYFNVNDQQQLVLSPGEGFPIMPIRVWQAMIGVWANYFVEPDYHVEAFGDKDAIEWEWAGAPGGEYIQIKAKKPGVAVLKVTYDAMQWWGKDETPDTIVGSYRPKDKYEYFDPIDPGLTGTIVVNVVAPGTERNIKTNIQWRDEFDIVYFDGAKTDYANYTFSPSGAEGLTVRAHRPLNDEGAPWGAGWSSARKNTDGSFTVKLYHGRNVVEVGAAGSPYKEYHVVTARRLKIIKKEEGRIYFDGLITPVEKLSGIYNPSSVYVSYSQGVKSPSFQYSLGDPNKAFITASSGVLTQGKIMGSQLGDGTGSHKTLRPGIGKDPNLSAGTSGFDSYGRLPDIYLTGSPPAPEPEYDAEIGIADGKSGGAQSGGGWSFADGVLTISGQGAYKITGGTDANRIAVAPGVYADITLSGVNIDSPSGAALSLADGAGISLLLEGENEMKSASAPGIEAGPGASLVITSAMGYSRSEGSLVVTGGSGSAGIGGASETAGGSITVAGGTVTTTGGATGAGIGGGSRGDGGEIAVLGGIVTATGGTDAAGIGGGAGGDSGTITISGPNYALYVEDEGKAYSYDDEALIIAVAGGGDAQHVGHGAGGETSGAISLPSPELNLQKISFPDIEGITAPDYNGTPASEITETSEFTGTVVWEPADSPFKPNTVYTATITLKPKRGYTLEGVAENFFKVAGAVSSENAEGSGALSAVFPKSSSDKDSAAPVITAQPKDASVEVGAAVKLSVAADSPDGGTLSYQWYGNDNRSASGGYEIEGAAAADFTPDTSAGSTTYYYAVVTNAKEESNPTSAASAAAKVTVGNTDAAGSEESAGGEGEREEETTTPGETETTETPGQEKPGDKTPSEVPGDSNDTQGEIGAVPFIPDRPYVTPASNVQALSAADTGSLPAALRSMVTESDGETVAKESAVLSGLGRAEGAATVKALPLFRADVPPGETGVVTIPVRLSELKGMEFGDLSVVKLKADGTVEPFGKASSPERIGASQYVFTDGRGNEYRPDDEIESGVSYLLSLGIEDGSDFDSDEAPGEILDPAAIVAETDTVVPGDSGTSGGSGGCGAGTFVLAALGLAAALTPRKRGKRA